MIPTCTATLNTGKLHFFRFEGVNMSLKQNKTKKKLAFCQAKNQARKYLELRFRSLLKL